MKKVTSLVLVASILGSGCSSSVPGEPKLSKVDRIAGQQLTRFAEQEMRFEAHESRKEVLGETVEVFRNGGGGVRVGGATVDIPRPSEPAIASPTYWGALALAAIGAGICIWGANQNPATQDEKDSQTGAYVLGGASGLLGVIAFVKTWKKRGEAVRYGEVAFRRDDFADATGGPYRFTVRGNARVTWTGHKYELTTVQVRLVKKTSPEYEGALRAARTALEKGDVDRSRQILAYWEKYRDRDPELSELLGLAGR